MGKPRAWTAAFTVVIAGMAVFASAAQALPSNFWGVVPQVTPNAEQLHRLRRGGVESIRIPVVWSAVQPNRGSVFDWSGVDGQIGAAAKAGLDVLPFLSGAPSWAVHSEFVPGSHNTVKAPSHLPASGNAAAGWTSFLAAAVQRYGPSGTFWAENPTVPKRPIRTWQIWNEENFKYFVTRPNPAEYGKLVKISTPAIKNADPGAKIVLGGMFAQPKEGQGRWKRIKPRPAYFASEFLEQMYKSTPGIGKKFNGIALHPYTYNFPRLAPEIEEVRSVLKRSHDAGKGIWITELGWSSEHPSGEDQFAKGLTGQKAQLEGAFSLLRNGQRKWKIQSVYWFSVDDQPGACNFCGGSGLFGEGFAPKPAWSAYVRFAGGSVE
ncbi:MAG TPA: glycosyl hydrolase [Solirubrobacterales bacterium]|nr:glycosyl hydrolase [Solirubrobacterales bacterium]